MTNLMYAMVMLSANSIDLSHYIGEDGIAACRSHAEELIAAAQIGGPPGQGPNDELTLDLTVHIESGGGMP